MIPTDPTELWTALGLLVERFRDDHQSYRPTGEESLSPDEDTQARFLAILQRWWQAPIDAFSAVSALRPPTSAGKWQVEEFMADPRYIDDQGWLWYWGPFASLVADAALGRAKEGLERSTHLVRLVRSNPVPERARHYLERAAALYMWGFDAEAIVICRSTLEAALHSRLADEEEMEEGEDLSLSQMIRLAGDHALLKPHLVRRAHKIRTTANDIVHVNPGAVVAPGLSLEVLRDLVSVLEVLFPA